MATPITHCLGIPSEHFIEHIWNQRIKYLYSAKGQEEIRKKYRGKKALLHQIQIHTDILKQRTSH